MEAETIDPRAPRRLRHLVRLRRLQVLRSEALTPQMRRITLGGPELEGFASPGFDDHVKLLFPEPGQDPASLPVNGPEGLIFPEGLPRPPGRDYTPRHHDPVAGTLTLDFALHEAGPATAWARQAAPGQTLLVAGPRGSMLLPIAGFDWHLLIGDATALPAIARRLEALPEGSRALVFVEVAGPQEELPLPSRAAVTLHWLHRGTAPAGQVERLAAALAATPFPPGEYQAWLAAESLVAKALRQQLLDSKGADPRWLKASGYWKRGAPGAHESFKAAAAPA